MVQVHNNRISLDKKLLLTYLVLIFRPLYSLICLLIFLLTGIYTQTDFSMKYFLLCFIIFYPINFITYGLNDVFDYKSDKTNSRKLNVRNFFIRLQDAQVKTKVISFFKEFIVKGCQGVYLEEKYHSLILKLCYSYTLIIILFSLFLFSYQVSIILITIITLAYLYSTSPIRLKTKPPFDIIINVVGYPLIIILQFAFSHKLDILPFEFFATIPFILGFLLYSQLVDYVSDKEAGDITFCTKYGRTFTIFLSIISFASIILIFSDLNILIYIVLLLLIFVLIYIYFNPNFNKFTYINVIILIFFILIALEYFKILIKL